MATNDFLPFGTGAGANVLSQASWAALTARGTGFAAGVAKSAEVNKALRQGAFIAAGLAQWLADTQSQNVLDDGDLAGLVTKLKAGIGGGGSLTANGWQKLPGGLIVQWGRFTSVSGTDDVVTFPVSFPTACFVALANERNATGWAAPTNTVTVWGATLVSVTQMKLSVRTFNGSSWVGLAGVAGSWIALGN